MIEVRLFAAAAQGAGRDRILVDGNSWREIRAELVTSLGPRFERVLAMCSVLTDGRRLEPDDLTAIPPGAVVDVLPPFAGG